jgi:hypothetical protein
VLLYWLASSVPPHDEGHDDTNPFADLPNAGITRIKRVAQMLDCTEGTVQNYFRSGAAEAHQDGPEHFRGVQRGPESVWRRMAKESASA